MDGQPSASGSDLLGNRPFHDNYVAHRRRVREFAHKTHLGAWSGSILIVDGASSSGRQIANVLNKRGPYKIHALYPPDYFPKTAPVTHRKRLAYPVDKIHFLAPVSEHRNYVLWFDSVVEICIRHKIHYIIPQHDTMAIFAARLEELRQYEIYVHTPPLISIHFIIDKLAMYRMLLHLGIWHHPWVFLGKETNSEKAIIQTARYIKESGSYPIMLTDRTEGSDSLHQTQGIFDKGRLLKWHGWTLLPVQQGMTSHFRKTSAHDQRAVIVLQKIGRYLNWHGGLSVTFWLPFSELDAYPRVMKIDIGIHEPMNAYYSGVDLIKALLNLRLPANSGTVWDDEFGWKNPDDAFDMPENIMEENLEADNLRQEEANVRQDEVAAKAKDNDSDPFPLRVMLAPDSEPPTRGGGVQARGPLDANSGTVSRTPRETPVVGSSGEGRTPETGEWSWHLFDTLRKFIGVDGHDGCVGEPARFDHPGVDPNVGICEWKTGVTTRQFVLESEQRIAASGNGSKLKRLATIIGDRTSRKSKEEHTPYSPRPWATSFRSVYNVAKQIVELLVKEEPGPTALSTLLRDDWPKPNPRGLRRDQYADIFKAHLWDGPAMPDGPWCLSVPVEPHNQQKGFRVYSHNGIPSPEVAYQFFVRHDQDIRTGTLLPLGPVFKDNKGKRAVQRAHVSQNSTPVNPVDLICVGEIPETWNSWTFVPDRDRPRNGLLIPTYNSPEDKRLLISRNPSVLGPGRCFFYHGTTTKHPQWKRPYRYRLSDHYRYTANDPRKQFPLPPDSFFFVDETLVPPVLEEGSFKPIIQLEHGIPRTDIVYYYHSDHRSQPHMGMFVPADHNALAEKRSLNYYSPEGIDSIQESSPAGSGRVSEAEEMETPTAPVQAQSPVEAAPEQVPTEPPAPTEPVQEQSPVEAAPEQVPTAPIQEQVPMEPVQEAAPTEPVREESLKDVWVAAEEYLGNQTEGTDELDGTNETNETNDTDE
ncbi:hypothetical protein B0T20DRAFT_461812 [Sordaria brevicollis]|uniref:Uncharacterized protein n=1 Tax=Sordaria brevicollis TaxID=83679 RepID=A0AAE0UBD5_SORBR|nr:hypothetical protein B0T20DRAFT_461812 [Sordaria brevicollis]